MIAERDSQHRLAKLAIILALALMGQFIARWIAGRSAVGVSAPAQHASVALDWILLVCVPFAMLAAPTLALSPTPLLDRILRRDAVASQLNRAFYRSLVLVLGSLASGLILLMLPHPQIASSDPSTDALVPLPVALMLAVAAPLREEVEFRLAMLTVVGWILFRLIRRRSISLVLANLAQALLFGIAHQVAGFTARSSVTFAGALLDPRTVAGFIFGYGYIRYGLEVAIIAHAIYDGAISTAVSVFAHS